MSLQVVINGPVAMAGSIPFLCRNNGINVPIIPATIMTATNDNEMAKAVPISCFQTQRMASGNCPVMYILQPPGAGSNHCYKRQI